MAKRILTDCIVTFAFWLMKRCEYDSEMGYYSDLAKRWGKGLSEEAQARRNRGPWRKDGD